VRALIDHVIVSGNDEFEIIWKFKSEYEALREYTGEVTA
jgi:hypothetical protein